MLCFLVKISSPIFDEGLALYHSIQMSEKIGGALQVGATQKGVPHIRVDIRCFCACKYFIKKKISWLMCFQVKVTEVAGP